MSPIRVRGRFVGKIGSIDRGSGSHIVSFADSGKENFMRRFALFLLLLSLPAAAQTPGLKFKFKTIKVPGAQSTAIFGVNNAGAMVGSYVDSGGVRHGFKLSAGKATKIDDPKGTDTYCFAINKASAIVGYYATSS